MESHKIDRRSHPDWLNIDQWVASDGWCLRRFQVSPAQLDRPLGSLIFQIGRADFIEKYIEIIDHWRRLGWAVEGFDWRGQGGSGRVTEDIGLGHGPPYAVLGRDLAEYCGEWTARTPGPHILMGHSMGGHLVLRLLVEQAVTVDGAVLISPMLGLNTGLLPEPVSRLVASMLCGIGLTMRRAWSEDSAKGSGHRQLNLTHSAERYEDEQWWRARDPMLDVGPPTWGWLRDSWSSIAGLLRPGVIERNGTPTLILCAEQDPLVRTSAIKVAAARMRMVELECIPGASHELLREIDPIRLRALGKIDDFLKSLKALKPLKAMS